MKRAVADRSEMIEGWSTRHSASSVSRVGTSERGSGLDGRANFVNVDVEEVERAGHARDAPTRDVGVDHGRFEALVSEQHLNGPDIHAALNEVSGETVAERVAVDGAVQGCRATGLDDCTLE